MTSETKKITQTESQLQEYICAVIHASASDNKHSIACPMWTSSVWWFNWEMNIPGGE